IVDASDSNVITMIAIAYLAATGIPDLHRFVKRARDDRRAIRRPGERGDLILMPAERQQRLPARCVPHLYLCIYGARCNALAVRRPHDRSHSGGVPAIAQNSF